MADYHVYRLSRLQAITARNMHQAQQETAHATLHSECDVTALVASLDLPPGEPVWITAHVVHALVQALGEHPGMNAHLTSDELCIYDKVKLGMMLHTGQGVMLACLEDAGANSLPELDAALRNLHARARTGRFDISETRGATFMVADLSAYRVDAFTPILLPSALAILGIGRVRPACLPTASGYRSAHLLSLNLTFDHRGTDGIAAARFLTSIVHRLEQAGA